MLTDLISELNIKKQDQENESQRSINDEINRQFSQLTRQLFANLKNKEKSKMYE